MGEKICLHLTEFKTGLIYLGSFHLSRVTPYSLIIVQASFYIKIINSISLKPPIICLS